MQLPDLSAAAWLKLAAVPLCGALLPLAWWWLRQRAASSRQRLAALTALMLFLTFDLIVVGAFTRLTDSGLGCPDWPGCYGEASPFGARSEIAAAEQAQPDGAVTWRKAWIEMVHRYLAMVLGVLAIAATAFAVRIRRRLPHSPWWAALTLIWLIVQGVFGALTVTMKLYPAIVTLHLLGGIVLLMLLVLQHESFADRPLPAGGTRAGIAIALVLLLMQVALGGWVSTNYAVLACRGFPACNGQWWPPMDYAQGFTVLRELGRAGHGGYLPFEGLVAIHLTHRVFAVLVVLALGALAAWLYRAGDAARRHYAIGLLLLLVWQLASGLSNVVLDWPLPAALAHSAGAAGLVGMLTSLLARSRREPAPRGRTAFEGEAGLAIAPGATGALTGPTGPTA